MLRTEYGVNPVAPELLLEPHYHLFKCENILYSVSARQAEHVALHHALVGQFVKIIWPDDTVLTRAAEHHDWGKLFVPEKIYFAPVLARGAVEHHFDNHELDTLRFFGSPWVVTYSPVAYTMGTHHQMELKPKLRFWLSMALGPDRLYTLEKDPENRIRSARLFISDNYIAGTEYGRPERELPKDKDLLVGQTMRALHEQFPHGLPLELKNFDHGEAYDIALAIAQTAHHHRLAFQPTLPQQLRTSLFYPGLKGQTWEHAAEYGLMV